MGPTPASLLDQLRGPDRAGAWGRFVWLLTPVFVRWAERLGVPPPDHADLIQDVFLVLPRALSAFRYDPGRSFRAWLRTVFVNKWKDASRKRVPVPLAAEGSDFPAPPVADPALDIDEAEYRAVLVSRAARLIETDFNRVTWRAFWATAVEDRAPGEVAAELGSPPMRSTWHAPGCSPGCGRSLRGCGSDPRSLRLASDRTVSRQVPDSRPVVPSPDPVGDGGVLSWRSYPSHQTKASSAGSCSGNSRRQNWSRSATISMHTPNSHPRWTP